MVYSCVIVKVLNKNSYVEYWFDYFSFKRQFPLSPLGEKHGNICIIDATEFITVKDFRIIERLRWNLPCKLSCQKRLEKVKELIRSWGFAGAYPRKDNWSQF